MATFTNNNGFHAKYPGTCAFCHGPIAVGQRISKMTLEGKGLWRHEKCSTPAGARGWR